MEKITSSHNRRQAGDRAKAAARALGMFQKMMTSAEIAEAMGISKKTVEKYKRDLIKSGKLSPLCFRITKDRREFIAANPGHSIEWYMSHTRMGRSTIARDLRDMGREDIKLSGANIGCENRNGMKYILKDFVDCHKWHAVHRAMTTRQQVTL